MSHTNMNVHITNMNIHVTDIPTKGIIMQTSTDIHIILRQTVKFGVLNMSKNE